MGGIILLNNLIFVGN